MFWIMYRRVSWEGERDEGKKRSVLPRAQALRKGSWGGLKPEAKEVESSLVPLRANLRKFSPPHDPLRSAWERGSEASLPMLTAVKREKFAKNKKTTSKERLSLLLFKVCYLTSILLIY